MDWLYNVIKLKDTFPRSLFREDYIYVEGNNDEATRFFKKHGVMSLKTFKTFRMNGEDRYTFVGCSILKKDGEKFDQALADLQKNMTLLGYRDYEDFCKEAFAKLGLV